MPASSLDKMPPRFSNLDIWLTFILLVFIVLFRPVPQDVTHTMAELDTLVDKAEHNEMLMGIDVSHFQGSIDWQDVSRHIDFAYIKGSEGITYADPKLSDNAEHLSHLNVPFGVYHFLLPSDDAQQQANNFLKTIKNIPFTLRPVLDVEVTQGMPKTHIQSNAKIWLAIVEKALGCKPIIYSYANFYDANLGKDFNDYPFWLAGYTKTIMPPNTRSNVDIWQYSEKGMVNGIKGGVDLDRITMPVKDLTAFECENSNTLPNGDA